MRTAAYVDAEGASAGHVELPDEIFGVEPNVPVMHAVVRAHLAAIRAGTHSTKTRAEVRGGGKVLVVTGPGSLVTHVDTWKSFRNLPNVLMVQTPTTYRVLAADVVVITRQALAQITGSEAAVDAPANAPEQPAPAAVAEDAPRPAETGEAEGAEEDAE